MNEQEFQAIAKAEWNALPEKFSTHIENVALLVEDEPSEELRMTEGLLRQETLLGHYHGIPATARGAGYGVGTTLPDTITLFRLPILHAAEELTDDHTNELKKNVTKVVRETLWHEIGHYFGLDEGPIREREAEGTNHY